MQRGERGFTFNEVLLAITIAAIGVLGYSLSSVDGIRRQRTSDNLTVAIQLAQDKLEQLKSRNDILEENHCHDSGELGLSAAGLPGGIFDRCWRIGLSPLGETLKQVDVTVSWRDSDAHELTLSTLVYVGAR